MRVMGHIPIHARLTGEAGSSRSASQCYDGHCKGHSCIPSREAISVKLAQTLQSSFKLGCARQASSLNMLGSCLLLIWNTCGIITAEDKR